MVLSVRRWEKQDERGSPKPFGQKGFGQRKLISTGGYLSEVGRVAGVGRELEGNPSEVSQVWRHASKE